MAGSPFVYRTFARRETHPARIGALAQLYGLASPPPSKCTMLELGCGDGGNLIPLAEAYPESSFVGIDLSKDAIDKGQAEARELGLSNITLMCGDLASKQIEPDAYDFVACHGVYSWVAPDIQQVQGIG